MKIISKDSECFAVSCPTCREVIMYSENDIHPAYQSFRYGRSTYDTYTAVFDSIVCPNCKNVIEATRTFLSIISDERLIL